MAVARADLVGSTSTLTFCIPLEDIWETREMICYVLATGKQHLGPHVVVGYGIKIFWPGLFIMSPDHLVKLTWNFQRGGGGGLKKIPSVGEVWIFSGITHYYFAVKNIIDHQISEILSLNITAMELSSDVLCPFVV